MRKMKDLEWRHSELTGKMINAAMEVHNILGAGYQESIYHQALLVALSDRSLKYDSEREYKISFKGKIIGIHKLDILVEKTVIVELKAVIGEMPEVFKAQAISYLKASGLEVALLINFGNESLDVKRLVRYKDYLKH